MKKSLLCVALALVLVFMCVSVVACNSVADNTEHFDKITKTLKLSKSYEGKSFISDGIGEATLLRLTDGDTTAFTLSTGEVVPIRYYGVDTPESTGGVEKWGKAASLFVKEQLSVEGTKFVLEATGPRAEHDNYGVRYLGYVWYKQPSDSDYKMMNLELVENGYTENKCINTSAYPYYEYFNKANKFAQSIKLRLYSDLEDPLYTTDPVDVTLKELYENIDSYYNTDIQSGVKVRFSAAITSLRVSDTGTYTFTAVAFDEDGTVRTINVYAGYASAAASGMEVGHLYRIVGNLQLYGGSYQISGILYNTKYGANRIDYTAPTQENYYITFDSTFNYTAHYYSTLYTDVTVVSSEVKDGVLTIVGTANQMRKAGPLEKVSTFTFSVPVPANYQNVFTAGKTFSVKGFQFVKDSGEISILNYSDITIR